MSSFFARALYGAALSTLLAAPAGAQSAPSPAPSTVPEIGRVVTSDRQDEPIGATARVTYVVTKDAILRHGDTTVAAALERVPGVNVTRYGAAGALAGVTIRGSSSAQVIVLLDGRPMSGVQLGTVDLGALPTTGVERIEVVEGGGSTLYGTGAVGGVINVITAKSRAAYGNVPLVTLRAGAFGERSIGIETKNVAFERRTAANAFDFPRFAGDAAGTRTNADLSATTFRATTTGNLGALRLAGSAGARSRHLGAPGELDFGTAFGARQDNVDTDARATVSLVHPHATTSLDLSGVRETLVYRDADARDANTTGAPFLNNSMESRVQASLRNVVGNEANRLVYGVDVARGVARNDAGAGAVAITPFAQSAIYAQDSFIPARGTRAYAGVRAERDGSLGGAITPAVGAIVDLGAGLAARANVSTAFRVPTQEDLFFPGFSNPALKPERTSGFDLTLSASRILGGVSIGAFTQFGKDLIVLNPNADFTTAFGPANRPLINAKRTSVAGFTAEIKTQPFNNVVASLNLTDTYRALDLTATRRRLAYQPVLTANLELAYLGQARSAFGGAGIIAHTVGQRDAAGAAPAYTRIDGYVRLRLAPEALLTLRGYNLGNERYAEVAHYPVPGRAFAVELSTR